MFNKDYIMFNIDYFKLQAKNLYKKDFKTQKQSLDKSYDYDPKYFKIDRIIIDYNINENKFSLMKAQHIIALMAGFDKWDDLIKSSKDKLDSAKLIFDNSNYRLTKEKVKNNIQHRLNGRENMGYKSHWEQISKYNKEYFATDPKRKLGLFKDWVSDKNIVSYYKGDLFSYPNDVPKFIKTGRVNWGMPNTKDNQPPKDCIDHEYCFKNKNGKVWLVSHFYNNTKENIERIEAWCFDNGLDMEILDRSES